MNIRTVAKRAGVSVATISRVLNHPDSVSDTTKEHVLSIMKELSYTPNWFARGLNLNKTNVIALVVPNILNPLYMQIAKGVEDVAHLNSYTMLLCNTEEDEHKERAYIEMFIQRKIDGLILSSSMLKKNDLDDIKNQNIPVVLIGRIKEMNNENVVYTDFEVGAYDATKHLIDLKYDRIAIITGTREKQENLDKLAGFQRALIEANMIPNSKYIIEAENTIESGHLAFRRLLSLAECPRAIFTGSDMLAFGVMEAVKSAGLRIPEDIALVGFDNVRMSSVVEPKLTTVSQPAHKMGLVAARLLFDIMENSGDDELIPQYIFLESKLKLRKSCGNKDRLSEIFD